MVCLMVQALRCRSLRFDCQLLVFIKHGGLLFTRYHLRDDDDTRGYNTVNTFCFINLVLITPFMPRSTQVQIICSMFKQKQNSGEVLLSEAKAKRRTLHIPNLMQISKNNSFCSFAPGSAHVKFDVSPWPKPNGILRHT